MMEVIPAKEHLVDKYQPCMEMGAVLATTMVRNTVLINHGPSGCSISNTHFRENNIPDGTNVPIVHTAVQQSDLVYGGTPKLRKVVQETADKYKERGVDALWLISSCATSMVQDDLVGVAKQVENESGVPIIAIDTPGFQGGYTLGAQAAYSAMLQRFADPGISSQQGKINLVGHHMMGTRNMLDDVREMTSLLEAADIQVNTQLTFNTSIEEIRNFKAAEASYVLTPEVMKDYERTSMELGVPNWGQDLILPLGLSNTEEWYLSIARRFGDEDKAKKQLKKDFDLIKRRIGSDYNSSWVMHDVAGKHVGLIGYAPFVTAMARFLFYDLNARPTVIGLWAESQQAIETAKKNLEEMSRYVDIMVMENPTYHQYGMALVEAKVDFAIGQKNDRTLVEGLRIPHLGLGGFYYFNHFTFIPWPFFGIRGTLHLLTEIAKATDELKAERSGWIARSYIQREDDYDRRCNADTQAPGWL